jgi:hypothetical protein
MNNPTLAYLEAELFYKLPDVSYLFDMWISGHSEYMEFIEYLKCRGVWETYESRDVSYLIKAVDYACRMTAELNRREIEV